MNDLVTQFASSGSHTVKLPHGFRSPMEKRIREVVQGTCSLPGYNDAAVKRTFAQAYTSVTETNFQKTVDETRKIEPYILLFYSSATKAAIATAQQTGTLQDDSWKLLPDRHVALFIRLASHMLRDQGHDRDRPELMTRLASLENKLLTNDQNLAAASSQDGGKMIEVQVPLSYDVKDMQMVQVVARTFGRSNSEVQADIDRHRSIWTEEAALRDMKAYQHRINANAGGSLRKQDFDLDEAFEEWKKSEAPYLSHIIHDILSAKPELAKTSSTAAPSSAEKPLPGRPQSFYGDDQAYADLGRALSSPDSSSLPFDHAMGFGSLSLDDASSSRGVEDAAYTFIPPSPRPFYKVILECCMNYDHLHADPSLEYTPLTKPRLDLLVELSVWWRVPQFSRLIALVEVAGKKFLDQEIGVDQLAATFRDVKTSSPDQKKPPHLHLYWAGLDDIDRSSWTIHDFAIYRRTLQELYDALLRDLYEHLKGCYGPKPPAIGVLMPLLETHIEGDPAFSPRPQQLQDFSNQLADALRQSAREAYREIVNAKLPEIADDWQFSHVIDVWKAVEVKLRKIQNRYKRSPELMGVPVVDILIETMLPLFEEDTAHIIKKCIDAAQDHGDEIDIEDGFNLYREMVKARSTHQSYLPDQPFAFDVEELLIPFVWRWVRLAEGRMVEFVENAIRQDTFQMRSKEPSPPDDQRHSVSIIDLFSLFSTSQRQVDELEWNNELHIAQFMTTLAHGFATGLERYCEEVGKMFAADLDRLSPEEIAAASRTAQEKFLQYAKDAWNTKEKPQPFQFSAKVRVTGKGQAPTRADIYSHSSCSTTSSTRNRSLTSSRRQCKLRHAPRSSVRPRVPNHRHASLTSTTLPLR